MSEQLEKDLKKAIEERDRFLSECRRLKRILGGAYSLLAAHGIDILAHDDEIIIVDSNDFDIALGLLQDAIEDETEFETEWNKTARLFVETRRIDK